MPIGSSDMVHSSPTHLMVVTCIHLFKRSVQDVRAYRGTDVASDQNLVIAKTQLNLSRTDRETTVIRTCETSLPEIRK